ncbi:MAG: hypothetical protein ABEJ70_09555 [Halobacteriaceae archaeon]
MEDFDELVSSLTPREDTGSVGIYQNTVAIACPACGEPFDDMIVCRDEYNSLNLDVPLDICTTTHDGNPVLFTHKP